MKKSPLTYIASGCSQVAFVVKDIQAGQKFFNKHLGVPHFYLFENIKIEEKIYRGNEGNFYMHLALAYAGEIQIELIEHISGESIFKEFLEKKGEGMHHIGFIVDDYQKAVDDFAANGYSILQSGRVGSTPGARFAFFDTEAAIGSIMEILVLDEDMRNLFKKIKQGKL